MSPRLLSGHLPSQMFNWITPMTPPRGSPESQRRRHINKHEKINICNWMDLTAKDSGWYMRGNPKPIRDSSCCTVILAAYGRRALMGLFSPCFFHSKPCWHTHKTAADQKKKKKKARKEILLWSQIRGKYNIVWDVWYYHGNPICVQSQQGHLFSMKKKKKQNDTRRRTGSRGCVSFHMCVFSTCGHVVLTHTVTTCIFFF